MPPTIETQTEMLTRRADFAPASVNAETRTVEAVWTTGARVLRGLFERYYEELSLDPRHVRMARITSGRAPVLDNHESFSTDAAVGVVESARLNRGDGVAVLRFAKDDERADRIWNKLVQGVLGYVSVGYRVHKYEKVEGGDGEFPVYRAIDWEPFEVSVVPLAADAGAVFRSEPLTEEPPAMTATNTTDPNVTSERERAAGILSAVRVAKLGHDFAEELIRSGVAIDAARAQIFERLAERDQETRTDSANPSASDFRRGTDASRIELMAEALAARFGGPAPSNEAREFMHMRAVDMAASCLEAKGIATRRMSANQIVERSLFGTGDFPELLTGTGARFLRHGYDSYQGGLRRIARASTATDFRPKQKLMLGETPTLAKVGEHGEFTRGSMAESKESYSLATYGRIVGLTRHALVNDDLGAWGDLNAKWGRGAAEFIAQQLVDLVAGNPTMSDSVALFHATHGNLGTPGAISITTLTEALKLMRLQKGLDGVTPIDVTPKYLGVPAALEVVARQYVAQINATKTSDVNPFTADLEVVVDPRLDAKSATAWYLAADPATIDTVEYSFLESEPGPQLFTRVGFDVDGVETKVRLDFGCGVIDHRGLFKNAGA